MVLVGAGDDGSQMSSAVSWHTGFNVLGLYYNELFHSL
jgi:hypothetical protein